MLSRRLLAALVLPLVLAACTAAPEPVHWGEESCAHCGMIISDERYAAQLVDRRARTYKFDAIECAAAFVKGGTVASDDVHSIWVADGPDDWRSVSDAVFVHSENTRSPMGGGYTAHASAAVARQYIDEVGGVTLTWDEVLAR
jgi:copper chaperone NosL